MMNDMLEKKKVKKPLPPEAEDDGPPTGPDGKPIKPRPYAKGGMCGGKSMKKMSAGGSASSRADGCAVKGKTKGKIC